MNFKIELIEKGSLEKGRFKRERVHTRHIVTGRKTTKRFLSVRKVSLWLWKRLRKTRSLGEDWEDWGDCGLSCEPWNYLCSRHRWALKGLREVASPSVLSLLLPSPDALTPLPLLQVLFLSPSSWSITPLSSSFRFPPLLIGRFCLFLSLLINSIRIGFALLFFVC